MLEQGYHPHQSLTSLSQVHLGNAVPDDDFKAGTVPDYNAHASGVAPADGTWAPNARDRKRGFWHRNKEAPNSPIPSPKIHLPPRKRRRFWVLVGVSVAVILVGIVTAVGVTVSSRHHPSAQTCTGSMTGFACDLGQLSHPVLTICHSPLYIDATCVCISTSSSNCIELAQAIITRTPTMNQLFSTNLSDSDVATAIWQVQGSPTGSNCAEQAQLIDVGSALDSTTLPNRTQWAQSALLWNLVQSQNATQVRNMQKFVEKVKWTSLSTAADGPVSDPSGGFAFQQSGYIWDFANQTATMPSASFIVAGQPSQDQINRVGPIAHTALDRMYTFASGTFVKHSVYELD
jgi:hypothetical protein